MATIGFWLNLIFISLIGVFMLIYFYVKFTDIFVYRPLMLRIYKNGFSYFDGLADEEVAKYWSMMYDKSVPPDNIIVTKNMLVSRAKEYCDRHGLI